MAKRALIEHRPWLLASVVAATAYYFLWNNPIGELWLILLKGTAVGLLAVYALRRTTGLDGAILVIVLALSAAADMAIELDFTAGGGLFLASHLVAIGLYFRNRRENTTPSQKLLALALLIGTPAVAYLLTNRVDIALYSVGLGAMAAAAWMSRFPRYRVGLGAVLFVISDWLIFSRMGPLAIAPLPDLLVWPLYYAGQLMIATGIVQTLRGETAAR
ncbi:lysoplasmalogenase family protein [uncultured Erythrobacter sp.]|uniref:lysoplasmalogenase family protein n=1 Tax=uncultured Erythrobacter sp. TaxID=263913 RepID=UPI0026277453|nr:lysoplasmalogenase family protein [uncultured Erythrobacter sp.]